MYLYEEYEVWWQFGDLKPLDVRLTVCFVLLQRRYVCTHTKPMTWNR